MYVCVYVFVRTRGEKEAEKGETRERRTLVENVTEAGIKRKIVRKRIEKKRENK